MSGKLGHSLKRKCEQITSSTTSINDEHSLSESTYHLEAEQKPSTSNVETIVTQSHESPPKDHYGTNVKKRKRNSCVTPDSSSSESETTEPNQILLEALQKIIELENELDFLQNDDENNYDVSDSEIAQEPITNFEAEALGFAMCARETLLFLQKEGISENSLLYQALKDKLVGSANGIPI